MAHEFIDHTSEITLRIEGPTFESLVAEATEALAELAREQPGASDAEAREFRVRAKDRTAMLVEWLNEMVYLSEAEQWLPVRAEATLDDEAELVVRARGVPLAEPWVLVKAATLHRASVAEGPGGWVAEVTLDV